MKSIHKETRSLRKNHILVPFNLNHKCDLTWKRIRTHQGENEHNVCKEGMGMMDLKGWTGEYELDVYMEHIVNAFMNQINKKNKK